MKTSGRSTQGVILMRPAKDDKITSISLLIEGIKEDEEEENK